VYLPSKILTKPGKKMQLNPKMVYPSIQKKIWLRSTRLKTNNKLLKKVPEMILKEAERK